MECVFTVDPTTDPLGYMYTVHLQYSESTPTPTPTDRISTPECENTILL